jgi:hypothetical protein
MSPSNPSPTDRFTLQINAGDTETEIFVIDGDLRLMDRGIGSLTTKPLAPGIYKIKACTGPAIREQHILLQQAGQVVNLPPMAFASPAPLDGTTRTHEYHMQNAASQSRIVHTRHGSGGSIFIFAREWTQGDSAIEAIKSRTPIHGLSLCTTGETSLELLENHAASDPDVPDPWSACNVELTPGAYRLSLALPTGDRQDLMLFAAPGWQTQVFLTMRTCSGKRIADLPKAAIYMAPAGQGFSPDDRQARQVELARLGLCHQRKVLSAEVDYMLRSKFENPMIGILGGHLAHMNGDASLIPVIVPNLRRMLQMTHPDVESLAIAAGMTAQPFTDPPMLRRSWDLIMRNPMQSSLLPKDSAARKFAATTWSEDPWLIRYVSSTAQTPASHSYAPGMDILPEAPARSSAFGAVEDWRSGKPLPKNRSLT